MNSKELEKNMKIRFVFVLSLIILGSVFNFFNIGSKEFFSFNSIGNWMIYVGVIALVIMIIKSFRINSKQTQKVDERALFIAAKANKVVFIFVILSAFVLMILDGIKPITMSYHLFLSNMICVIVLVYLVSYKIIEKKF